ncbi:DUF3251 domain-containing protein [[Erwinia] mediterraneensis]|uniref:DUF3251 domain-containing protein n=1 Tax=[Erwinia] mediterraneensis TaxID=2161819 RepID=UPI0010320BF5|nr:DUF3251 domain-containing protein [[Erwinia] mediterraneensis]
MLRRIWPPVALALLALSGCSTRPASPEVQQLNQEVKQLNQEMRQLTRQAAALEQQSLLNSHSAQGAWLLPAASHSVTLQTRLGELRLSLTQIESEASGTRANLNIRAAGEAPLPALRAEVQWGELDPASGKPLSAEALSQRIEVPASLLPQSSVMVPLRLSGIAPEQLGFVRVHAVEPLPAAQSAQRTVAP